MTADKTNTQINVLITGASGQLGSEFYHLSKVACSTGFNLIFLRRKDLDLNDCILLSDFCLENEVSVIVNCAAYTAVDMAEDHYNEADAVNHMMVKRIAEVAKKLNIKLIHISTDYVFDGESNRPYKETDQTNPQSVYGKTKLDGERAMQAINPLNSIIIRTSWVYSEFGANFVKTMIRLSQERDEISVVSDQVGTPTNARDLAVCILNIIPQLDVKIQDGVEIFHFSNAGACSWYDFANAVFEINKIKCKIIPISSEFYPTPAKRPFYSIMDKSKILKTFKVSSKYWRESLADMNL
jgi:dTDP-4-dehydrorhamnose reductase